MNRHHVDGQGKWVMALKANLVTRFFHLCPHLVCVFLKSVAQGVLILKLVDVISLLLLCLVLYDSKTIILL